MKLQEGEMIFVEECTASDRFMNVVCGDRRGKLSREYGKRLFQWKSVVIHHLFST